MLETFVGCRGNPIEPLGLTKADDDLLLVRERWEQVTNQDGHLSCMV